MAVKRSQSAARTLTVLEAVAELQPVGVSALARHLDADKSAMQRALMTLADDGWIRAAPGSGAQWELTARLLAISLPPSSVQGLRRRARPVLEELRGQTGETVYLAVPDARRFVVVDALESVQMLRMVPPVGMIVPLLDTATGRVVLAFSGAARRRELIGADPDAAFAAELDTVRSHGFAVSDGEIDPGSVSLAAPILAAGAEPLGAIVVAGPRERIGADRRDAIGARLAAAAAGLSRSVSA